jgi:hypothetical protein
VRGSSTNLHKQNSTISCKWWIHNELAQRLVKNWWIDAKEFLWKMEKSERILEFLWWIWNCD